MVISVENRQFLPHPCIWRSRWRGFPWNWVTALGVKKVEWWAIGPTKKFGDILRRLERTWQTDRQTDRLTDGRTDTRQQQRPRLRIASRGKNCSHRWLSYNWPALQDGSVQKQNRDAFIMDNDLLFSFFELQSILYLRVFWLCRCGLVTDITFWPKMARLYSYTCPREEHFDHIRSMKSDINVIQIVISAFYGNSDVSISN